MGACNAKQQRQPHNNIQTSTAPALATATASRPFTQLPFIHKQPTQQLSQAEKAEQRYRIRRATEQRVRVSQQKREVRRFASNLDVTSNATTVNNSRNNSIVSQENTAIYNNSSDNHLNVNNSSSCSDSNSVTPDPSPRPNRRSVDPAYAAAYGSSVFSTRE